MVGLIQAFWGLNGNVLVLRRQRVIMRSVKSIPHSDTANSPQVVIEAPFCLAFSINGASNAFAISSGLMLTDRPRCHQPRYIGMMEIQAIVMTKNAPANHPG